MNLCNLKVSYASKDATKYAISRWHYRGKIPPGPYISYSVYEDGKFIGVVLFGNSAAPALSKRYNLNRNEVCELSRIALDKHKTHVSKIVKIAINQGHKGTLYKACNFIYIGDTGSPSNVLYFINGSNIPVHCRTHATINEEAKKRSTQVKIKPKQIYVFPLENRKKYLYLKKELKQGV